MYLRIINENIIYPFDLELLRKEFKYVGFPKDTSTVDLTEYNVYKVVSVNKPIDPTRKITEGTPELINGIYYQKWIVSNYTIEELEVLKQRDIKNIKIRAHMLLKDSSWFAIDTSGVTNPTDWANFRKDLILILKSSDPRNLVFPSLPEVKLL